MKSTSELRRERGHQEAPGDALSGATPASSKTSTGPIAYQAFGIDCDEPADASPAGEQLR